MTDLRNKIENKFVKYLIYIILGALWSLSNVGYVKYFGSGFAFFTLSFFIFFIQKENIKVGMKYSIVFGFSAYLVHFWWMSIPMTIVMGSSLFPTYISAIALFIGVIVTLFVSLFQAFYYTIVFLVSKYMSFNKKIYFYLSFALYGTVLDYFYPKIWADFLGYSQFNNHLLIQSVDLLGISLISMIILLFNATFAFLYDRFSMNKSLTLPLTLLCSLLLIVAGLNFYGSKRILHIETLSNKANSKSIALIQGNNSGLDKRDPDRSRNMIRDYNALTKTILNEKPDLVVWPESAIPMWFSDDIFDFSSIKHFNRVPLLLGTLYRQYTENSYKIFNSLILIDENNNKKDIYFKNKLLPFTEDVPFDFLDFIMPLIGLKEFTAGDGPRILSSGEINAAVNICYEAIIPDYIRKSIKIKDSKANVIINATNDSWFGKTIEPEMHLRISSIRSIENRRYLVRVTCTGYSVVVNALGHIEYRSGLYVPEAHVHKVPLLEIDTVYQNGGWLFVYIFGLILFALLLIIVLIKYRIRLNILKIQSEIKHKEKLIKSWLN
ncbi:MAG: apolipoprotein N-acyltransferase [Spirochaetes bacterium GWF1_31_7]|nr:MAG: apolipoprotein N-acyltransferase [Spirochaetes bacterium GWE1_32_154]OHD50029.1 MAG: apolipoprotein N-acyltransferase [Spirochaetes bacterium GWE2_31_10]OHD52343.1 MAG: apolipoprotein N-acyltransferase [Spirochaetes bacterium GWF1_31_7]OHD82684.1 MAG: apolipoprotein N-acyltransferase [Spirochaetes bacterium RIFOXYB1_FULL_32_8]HBI38494.1 apolipoprotein N-acyltransferase [Spirochaetia bacterium]